MNLPRVCGREREDWDGECNTARDFLPKRVEQDGEAHNASSGNVGDRQRWQRAHGAANAAECARDEIGHGGQDCRLKRVVKMSKCLINPDGYPNCNTRLNYCDQKGQLSIKAGNKGKTKVDLSSRHFPSKQQKPSI